MKVYQIYMNVGKSDSSGWHYWIEPMTMDQTLYFKREDAQKVIDQNIVDCLAILGQRMLENPENVESYTEEAELLKENWKKFAVGDDNELEEWPIYGIRELTVI